MICLKSVMVWLIFILAESLNGTVRIFWLVPTCGDRLGHQISFAIGSVLIIAIATRFIRWLQASQLSPTIGAWPEVSLRLEIIENLQYQGGYSYENHTALITS